MSLKTLTESRLCPLLRHEQQTDRQTVPSPSGCAKNGGPENAEPNNYRADIRVNEYKRSRWKK